MVIEKVIVGHPNLTLPVSVYTLKLTDMIHTRFSPAHFATSCTYHPMSQFIYFFSTSSKIYA